MKYLEEWFKWNRLNAVLQLVLIAVACYFTVEVVGAKYQWLPVVGISIYVLIAGPSYEYALKSLAVDAINVTDRKEEHRRIQTIAVFLNSGRLWAIILSIFLLLVALGLTHYDTGYTHEGSTAEHIRRFQTHHVSGRRVC